MTFYVISDVHGFYDEMIAALNEAGFDKDNPEHFLISLGDTMDRGRQPIEVMNYLQSVPNKVLIKGNHEQLIIDACQRGYCLSHDVSNGTYLTIADIGGMGEGRSEEECCARTLARIGSFIDQMVPYFETKNYVFTHGWLPLWIENWRKARTKDWDDAAWENGMMCALSGDTIEKTVVCGHYHTSWGRAHIDHEGEEFGKDADFSPYYYLPACIAIDACTAYSGKVNVLVIEDEFLEE